MTLRSLATPSLLLLRRASAPRWQSLYDSRNRPPAERGKTDAQTAVDRWLSRARHRPALDRPGYRRDQMARVELHDQPDPMGRIRRRAGRGRPDPDLARQALGVGLHNGPVMAGLVP